MRAVSAVVPAAGLSSRYGGPNKLLQPWSGLTVVGSVASILRRCGLPVIVVTGRDADEVALAVAPSETVFNPRFREGLGTSIAAGVAARPACDGFLIALGDMPELQLAVVRRLLAEFEVAPTDVILAPVYQGEPGRPGHPVLFGASYRSALEELTGDEGARSIMRANRDKLRLIDIDGELPDIDEP